MIGAQFTGEAEVRFTARLHGGAVRVEVPEERREVSCLAEAGVDALVDVAGRIERYFGSHQDVEWAIARGGELPASLFVVQSRPVTAMKRPEGTPAATSAMALVMSAFGVKKDS